MALRGQGWAIFSWTRTHVGDIALVSIVFSFIISLVVYIKSFFGEPLLSLGGNTGNPIYDVSNLGTDTFFSLLQNFIFQFSL